MIAIEVMLAPRFGGVFVRGEPQAYMFTILVVITEQSMQIVAIVGERLFKFDGYLAILDGQRAGVDHRGVAHVGKGGGERRRCGCHQPHGELRTPDRVRQRAEVPCQLLYVAAHQLVEHRCRVDGLRVCVVVEPQAPDR